MRKFVMASAVIAVLSGGMLSAQAPAAAPSPATQDASAKVLASLQGIWVVISVNGESIENQGVEMALKIEGNKYSQLVNGTIDETGTVKIDASKTPISFDLNIIEGSDAGKLQPGIIDIKGDTIAAYLANPGGSVRPASFDSADGAIYVIARKAK